MTSCSANDDLAMTYLKWKQMQNQETNADQVKDDALSTLHKSNRSSIKPNCKAFITEFGLRSSRFIKCSVDNARPFRFCEGCVVHYQRSKTVYGDIVDNDESLDNCRKELLNSDRVQVISSVQRDIDRIWQTADCKQCFSSISEDKNGTVHYTLTERTKEFLAVYKNFTECIPANRTTYNHSVCTNCEPYYNEMNTKFDKMLNDPLAPQHVCMDIVDMMNYTRLIWGEQLKCTDVNREYTAVLTIAIGFLLLPVFFYVGLAVYGTKRTRNLIKQKRLAFFNHTKTYGTLDSPPLLTEDGALDVSRDSANQSASSSQSLESYDQVNSGKRTVNNRSPFVFS